MKKEAPSSKCHKAVQNYSTSWCQTTLTVLLFASIFLAAKQSCYMSVLGVTETTCENKTTMVSFSSSEEDRMLMGWSE